MRRWLVALNYTLFVIYIINFVACFEIGVVIGGDTRGGKIEHGKYYLEYKGDLTEVSPATYRYSKVHGTITWATIPLAVICMGFIAFSQRHAPTEVFKPDKRALILIITGGTIGSIIGALAMLAVPYLFDSRALRLPWSFIPEGFLFGMMLGGGLSEILLGKHSKPANNASTDHKV